MHNKKQRWNRLFSIFASLLMIVSLITPGLADARAGQQTDAQTVTEGKISETLTKAFKEEEQVTFLVKFKDKADLTTAKQEALTKADKAGLTSFETEDAVHSAVLASLRETAFSDQLAVHEYLLNAKKDGLVEDVQPFYVVNGMAVTATKDIAEKVASFDEVEFITKNETRQLLDVEVGDILASADEELEWNIDRVGAHAAWTTGADGTGAVVASIDTGAQWDHPALKEKYYGYNAETGEVDHSVAWFDAVNGEDEAYDDQGHGTHTIGTMVGGEPDGKNKIGVAPGAKFVAAKAFNSSGGATDATITAAAQWVAENGNFIDVVNNSWSSGSGTDEWFMDIVDNWIELDIFPVFAAGNVSDSSPGGPGSVASPGNYPQSFAVGNTNEDDLVSSSSLRGPSPYGEIKPDVAAPGTNIRSSTPGGGYGVISGTSMAAPAVAGVVALLTQMDPTLSIDEKKEIMKDTAMERTDDEYTEVPNNGYGYGIVDAYNAVNNLLDGSNWLEGTVTGIPELPVEGQISIKETGLTRAIDPHTGYYSMLHGVGEYTAVVEAYGYEKQEQAFEIFEDEETKLNFELDALPRHTVSGQIINGENGEPVEDANLFLSEDFRVNIENSDAEGNYSFETFDGDYTLSVIAQGYHIARVDVSIDGDHVKQDIILERFYSYPVDDQIVYDDGTYEAGSRYFEANRGYAVRMSLPEGQESIAVTEAHVHFLYWEINGPEFAVEVWDSDEDGNPRERIAGPVDGEANERDDWTDVPLGDESVVVDGDFYMVYVQKHGIENSPMIGLDGNDIVYNRGYTYVDGEFQPYNVGNPMIRATVEYEVYDPYFINVEDGFITNDRNAEITGQAAPTTDLQIVYDGNVEASELDEDGLFSYIPDLTEGDNIFRAETLVDGNVIRESETANVILDTVDPELAIAYPQQGDAYNKEVITVEGTVSDLHLDRVEVNGQKATIDGDSYSVQILVQEGENEVEAIAFDKAGNSTTKVSSIDINLEGPTIDRVEPSVDQYVHAGDEIDVFFTSGTTEGQASFKVKLPGLSNTESNTSTNMEEVEPGLYRGTWMAPENMEVTGAVLEVSLTDQAGNTTTEEAGGKLYVSSDKTDRIAGDIRYDTAIETSQAGWDTSDTVILARGDYFADALAGVPLAYGLDAPILLTPTDYLWEATGEEIERLGAQDVVILGGPNAVSEEVAAELTATGLEVDRVDGGDRFTTAALIAERVAPEGSSEIAVVNGMDFPDALSIASSAAIEGMPILLAQENWISDKTLETIDTLNAETTYVAGGPKVISEDLAADLPGVNRLEGSDRFDTNIDVLEHFGVESKHMYAATGMNYADALTGAVLAAKNDSSILFVHQRVPEVTSNYITDQGLNRITIFGGEVAVDKSVEQTIAELLQ